tara:strand:- start:338 stop:472 length:135 start_codon:yes stop_codon:yes gene_type:complete
LGEAFESDEGSIATEFAKIPVVGRMTTIEIAVPPEQAFERREDL